MSDLPRNLQILLTLLAEHTRLAAFGGGAEARPPDAVVVLRDGEVSGTWMRSNGALEWIPAGTSVATHRVLTAEAAVLHTVSVLVRY